MLHIDNRIRLTFYYDYYESNTDTALSTEELEDKLRAASKAGTLDQLMRDLNLSGEGGMAVEMALQEEVSSFIQRYPWAAELDPKYIKYLIDNPAELQDLLGENEGG